MERRTLLLSKQVLEETGLNRALHADILVHAVEGPLGSFQFGACFKVLSDTALQLKGWMSTVSFTDSDSTMAYTFVCRHGDESRALKGVLNEHQAFVNKGVDVAALILHQKHGPLPLFCARLDTVWADNKVIR